MIPLSNELGSQAPRARTVAGPLAAVSSHFKALAAPGRTTNRLFPGTETGTTFTLVIGD